MSVLIKGVKMPSCCENCPCNDDDWRCGALGATFDDLGIDRWEIKPSFCPLVEVPEPHGDLIDRDSLIRARCSKEFYGNNLALLEWDNKCIDSAPTVIESEGE